MKFQPAHVASARVAACGDGGKTQFKSSAPVENLHRHLHLHRAEMRRHTLDSERAAAIKSPQSVLTDTRLRGRSARAPILGDASGVQGRHFVQQRRNK